VQTRVIPTFKLLFLSPQDPALLPFDLLDGLADVILLDQRHRDIPIQTQQLGYVAARLHRIHTVPNILQVITERHYLLLGARSQVLQARLKLLKVPLGLIRLQKSLVYAV